MKCMNCGAGLDPAHGFCDNCGMPVATDQTLVPHQPAMVNTSVPASVGSWAPAQPLPEQVPPGPADQAPLGYPPAQTLPGSPVRLGIDEVMWRRYHVLKLRRLAKGDAFLYVTDSRLVFFAYSTGFGLQKPSMLVQQVKISQIDGLNAYVSRRFSLALLFTGLSLFVLGVIFLFTIFLIPLAFVAWFFALVCIITQVVGSGHIGQTIISVNSRRDGVVSFGGAESIAGSFAAIVSVIFHPWRFIIGGTTADYIAAFGLPGQDSDEVVRDLGALVLDLQTRGNLAAEHWQMPPVAVTELERERGVARR